ncbi:MAG: peptidase S41 [Bacteroidetes bacterium GWD2_45_23]|nr:MAG: peptidase S41 [Bacteroidetes bacterium GWC2_46_850]OFX66923.1 MAG: peptidase S41 [Bacteroidetes bacterium GWC1_47_7]OFX83737.1 MAG: peptidase S41 [Bacteroidetes bacterium GWD2_45_23]HAR39147.1 peptidase S41 [Porphyromonadaceae bacterium]HBB00952.1 peptidase S41 [Porphyromonadaceae bacterium]
MDSEKKVRTWLPLWIGIGIALGIFIGSKYGQFGSSGTSQGSGKIDAVLNYVRESYVDTVNMRQLVEDALPNIIQQLDPHSEYFSAADMKRVNEDLEGHFSGIGVSFYVLRDTIVVTSIVPGGPSEAAGIKSWDRIVMVNDTAVAGIRINNEEVLKRLRGEKGSEVKLGIRRANEGHLVEITVTRGDIPMSSVNAAYMLTDKIGFIKLGRNFGFNTFSEFISAISKLKNQGAGSFLIDLRGNTGGSLDIVVAMVNEFLHKGDLIVYAEGRSFPRIDNYANGSGTCKEDDVIILVDELSASASEIFAGAIQDHDRGLVIGRRTFGKGLVQSQRNFPDGSAVRLTVARYYTASGRSIQRGYEKGKYDEYEMDAINRFLEGDYINVDTASNNHLTPYKTLGGRTVYGGDGIMPDIFVARDTTGINSYYNAVVNNRLDERYSMIYSDMYRERLGSFITWQELYKYLRQQPLLLNLASFADNNGIRRRPYYIQESGELLENTMYAYIVRNFFGEEAFWAAYYKEDPLIKRGVELIEKGEASHDAVINEEYRD